MPRQDVGSATDLFRVPRPVNIISLDFWQFNVLYLPKNFYIPQNKFLAAPLLLA